MRIGYVLEKPPTWKPDGPRIFQSVRSWNNLKFKKKRPNADFKGGESLHSEHATLQLESEPFPDAESLELGSDQRKSKKNQLFQESVEIRKKIQSAVSLSELYALIQHHKSSLNVFHITSLFVKMSKLAQSAGAGSHNRFKSSHYGSPLVWSASQTLLHHSHKLTRSSSQQTSSVLSGRSRGSVKYNDNSVVTSESAPVVIVKAMVSDLMRAMQPLILEFDAQGVVNVLHSLSKLYQLDIQMVNKTTQGQRVKSFFQAERSVKSAKQMKKPTFLPSLREGTLTRAVCEDLLYVSTQLFTDFTPQAFSNMAYAVAVLGLKPERPWIQAFCRCSLDQLPSFSSQSLSNTIWAFAKINLSPDPEWEKLFYKECCARSQDMEPQAISNILWAAAALDLRPDMAFKMAILAVTSPATLSGRFSPQGVCNLLWGLSQIYPNLPGWWMSAFAEATYDNLPSYSLEQLSTLLYAASFIGNIRSGKDVTERWLKKIQDLIMASMTSASPQVLANAMYAVGKMKLQPPLLNTSFLSSLLTQSRQQLPVFIPQALANSMWGLARIGYSPDPRWMAAFIEESFLKLPLFNAQELSNTAWSLATLRYTPDSMWMSRFEKESVQHMSAYTPQNLSNTAWALSTFRYRPTRDWCEAFLQQISVKHQVLSNVHAIDILSSLPELGMAATPQALSSSLFLRLATDLSTASGRQLSALLQASVKLGFRPSPQWLSLVCSELEPQLMGMELDGLAEAWWGLAALGHQPSQEWTASFTSALQAALSTITHYSSVRSEARLSSGSGAKAASRIIISCARSRREVPGGATMLDSLLRTVIGEEEAQNSPAVLQPVDEEDRSHPSSPGAMKSFLPAGHSPVTLFTSTTHSQSLKGHLGLVDLDAAQVLLLMEALVELGYEAPEAVLGQFSKSARKMRASR
ncbi:hypothetical protein CEUSTIGMA_g1500.t1 [Chlamydomonas eustigma]|uniref:RAP domain-containing protein n=1 Tax=Chlamydomonas eustigma TaxID=1157962 RepID=A0A250WU17_9CHLO|nr:hypothetical protein CEUSTIGMA_g1500.t1 [Chlamydomonas eustigma]|eukprot:GAX74050.1 hypothetical protein CEUSTIGMA_g1500.t1 [Chlamydomonas eustigma]